MDINKEQSVGFIYFICVTGVCVCVCVFGISGGKK